MGNKQYPQLQLFNAVYLASLNLGYDTYDYLPADDAAYPFVYVGETFSYDERTKGFLYGRVAQTVHIYGVQRTPDQREGMTKLEFSSMMGDLKKEMRQIKETANFKWRLNQEINDQMLPDTTTNIRLFHGIIESEYTFN
ncbi:hypothetical protein [Alkalicoccus luteus]|uniref:DUF3168 domain-containing protein n=1 Tax=Alkalicoccus luteus TaxID=1237094 RepID=A0A969PYK2_9BACI|nr:hypothetical protein [Alkalicoccus luteus]NJP37922.1 hypothetical protein [Alkalicoccus luteus]